MRSWAFRALAFLPSVLVGATVALSPDPSGGWDFLLGQRLLYVHVPLAWSAYAGYLALAVAAGLVLWRGSTCAGQWMRATVEPTAVFAGAALASGLAWSYEFALFEPLEDPKVLTTVVLVAVLVGLWVLSAASPPSRRDDLVAGLAVVGFLAVPASYLASRLATPHPDFTRPAESISPTMLTLLVVSTAGFVALLGALAWLRRRLLRLEEDPSW